MLFRESISSPRGAESEEQETVSCAEKLTADPGCSDLALEPDPKVSLCPATLNPAWGPPVLCLLPGSLHFPNSAHRGFVWIALKTHHCLRSYLRCTSSPSQILLWEITNMCKKGKNYIPSTHRYPLHRLHYWLAGLALLHIQLNFQVCLCPILFGAFKVSDMHVYTFLQILQHALLFFSW